MAPPGGHSKCFNQEFFFVVVFCFFPFSFFAAPRVQGSMRGEGEVGRRGREKEREIQAVHNVTW